MKFEGTVDIKAPRERVWAFLMDPNRVGPCGPGVESVEVIDDTHYKAKAKVGIGFINANVRHRPDGRRDPAAESSRHQGERPGPG